MSEAMYELACTYAAQKIAQILVKVSATDAEKKRLSMENNSLGGLYL